MNGIAAPKQLRPLSRTGRAKPGYIFKMLRLRGFEAFDPVHRPYAVVGETELTRDVHGVPITRSRVAGELVDASWWHGPAADGPCAGCGVADGRARRVVRMTRPARVRQHNRVPELSIPLERLHEAPTWHPGCLSARLTGSGRYGQDVAIKSGRSRCACKPVRQPDGTMKVKHEHK